MNLRKIIPGFVFLGVIACLFLALFSLPSYVERIYGPPSPALGPLQRIQYGLLLLWHSGDLTQPPDREAGMQEFVVSEGESVPSIAYSLELAGLISSAPAFSDYLVYSGLDTSIQSGTFELSAAMPAIAIARELQDVTPGNIKFSVLAGWRIEEVAASLPTSGLLITPDEFIVAARAPRSDMDFIPQGTGSEGFLFPATYTLPREISAEDLVTLMVQNFALYMGSDLRGAIDRQGISIFEAVTIASMVEREAIVEDEMPMIASVFLNRLGAGMKFDSDPTVQYAIGWNPEQQTWWTNPLSSENLQVDSPYNTYLYPGFPPTPISNPSLEALQAVAYPAQTPYYYFRAACDGSGRHLFAETFEQHVNNGCQ